MGLKKTVAKLKSDKCHPELDLVPGRSGWQPQAERAGQGFQSHFPVTLEHRVSTTAAVPHSTVIVGLVLGLQPRDSQEPCIGRGIFGSREAAGDLRALVLVGV